MYRPPLPPEPDNGWRVVMPGVAARTFETEEAADAALHLAKALGITDAYILRIDEKES